MRSSKLVLGMIVAAVGGAVACGDVESATDAAPMADSAPMADAPRDVVCGAQPVEILPNGSFDDPSPAWTLDPTDQALLCGNPPIMPASGTKAGCLGNVDGRIFTLTQQVPLPAGVTQVTLTGQRCITTQDTATADNDILEFALLDGTATIATIGRLTNQNGGTACDFTQFTINGPVSRDPVTATLRIRSTLDSEKTTTFYIDTLSLKASCTP